MKRKKTVKLRGVEFVLEKLPKAIPGEGNLNNSCPECLSRTYYDIEDKTLLIDQINRTTNDKFFDLKSDDKSTDGIHAHDWQEIHKCWNCNKIFLVDGFDN